MKPPADLPLEVVLVMEAFARRLQMPVGEFWAVVYRQKPAPPGWAASWSEAFAPLTSEEELSTLHTVNTSNVSSNALRSRAALAEGTRKSKAMRALARKGITIAEAAQAVEAKLKRKVPRSTAQAWFKGKDDPLYRAIPQDAADVLAGEPFEIPVTAWPRVIPAP